MANISIYREAKKGQISSYHHLVCQQDFTNQDIKNNPNKGNSNLMFYVENGKYKHLEFYRDGENQELMEALKTKELELDKFARDDYKKCKLEEKKQNPDKKIRTVLQSKDLKKEFVIAIGGDKNITPSDFANKTLKAVDAILTEKGLTRDNIVGIFVHNDEKTLHCHCVFNEYSFEKHTTSNQLGKPKIPAGATKKETSEIIKKHREDFGKFQDIVAEAIGMDRGQKNSKAKHLSKAQHFEKKSQEVEQLERTVINLEAGRNKAKKDMEEYQFQANKQAQELIKLGRTRDNLLTELDTLKTAQKDVYLPTLKMNVSNFEDALFNFSMNQLPEEKQLDFLSNKNEELPKIMEEFSRSYDRIKPKNMPDFQAMVKDCLQKTEEIKNKEKNEMEQEEKQL